MHTYSCCHTGCSDLAMKGQCLKLSHGHANMRCRTAAPTAGSSMQPMSRGHVCKSCVRARLASIHRGLASGLLTSIAVASLQLSGPSVASAETYVDVQNDIPLVRSDLAQRLVNLVMYTFGCYCSESACLRCGEGCSVCHLWQTCYLDEIYLTTLPSPLRSRVC